MYEKRVANIFTCAAAGEPMQAKSDVHAVPGKGLVGDRYFNGTGHYSNRPGPDRQITLIEKETFDAIRRDFGIVFAPDESRRNIVTENVALNHLVDRKFKIGEVELQGIRLSFPCDYLTKLTGKKVLQPLLHRAGLNAEIITEGTIKVDDRLEFL